MNTSPGQQSQRLALIEVTAVLEDGRLVPSSSLGNNKTWIEQAEGAIIDVNAGTVRHGGHARHLLRPAAAAQPRPHSFDAYRPAHRQPVP